LELYIHLAGVFWSLKELGKPPAHAWCDIIHLVDKETPSRVWREGVHAAIPPFTLDSDLVTVLIHLKVYSSLSMFSSTHLQDT
jgi:hypothetical protein